MKKKILLLLTLMITVAEFVFAQPVIKNQKVTGGDTTDLFTCMDLTKDGGMIIGGTSYSGISGQKTDSVRGGVFTDYWIVKLDKKGNIEWDKTIGGDGIDELKAMRQTKDGGYVLAGISRSGISGVKTENSKGGLDYWIIKVGGKNLKSEWDKTIGGDGEDYLLSINESKKGHYVMGGYSYSGISGDKTQHRRGGYDYWMVKLIYNKTGNLKTEPAAENILALGANNGKNFIFYPNPVKDMLHIQNSGKATFILINQSGKTILTKTINGNGEINVSHLPAGLYYLKNNETGAVHKVMITK